MTAPHANGSIKHSLKSFNMFSAPLNVYKQLHYFAHKTSTCGTDNYKEHIPATHLIALIAQRAISAREQAKEEGKYEASVRITHHR